MILHLSAAPTVGGRCLTGFCRGTSVAGQLWISNFSDQAQTRCLLFFFLATAFLPQPLRFLPRPPQSTLRSQRCQQHGARSDFRCRSPPLIPRPEESIRSARLQSARPGCARTNQSDGRAKRLQPYGRQQVRPRSAELNLLWSIPQDYVGACWVVEATVLCGIRNVMRQQSSSMTAEPIRQPVMPPT